jgi:hypothetical protein
MIEPCLLKARSGEWDQPSPVGQLASPSTMFPGMSRAYRRRTPVEKIQIQFVVVNGSSFGYGGRDVPTGHRKRTVASVLRRVGLEFSR